MINDASITERAQKFILQDPLLCREIAKILSPSEPAPRSYSMTSRMRELYGFISAYSKEHDGVAPSFDEMQASMGLASKASVHRLVCSLEERGLIRRLHNRARAIEVLKVAA